MLDWSKIEPNTVVRCTDKHEAESLALEVSKAFPDKDLNPRDFARWFDLYDDTCYNLRLGQMNTTYGSGEFYQRNRYEIIQYSDLVESCQELGEIDGGVSIEFLREKASKSDLCLHMHFPARGAPSWTWSNKSYCYVEHPEIRVFTLDDLRVGASDLGEISLSELSFNLLFGGGCANV